MSLAKPFSALMSSSYVPDSAIWPSDMYRTRSEPETNCSWFVTSTRVLAFNAPRMHLVWTSLATCRWNRYKFNLSKSVALSTYQVFVLVSVFLFLLVLLVFLVLVLILLLTILTMDLSRQCCREELEEKLVVSRFWNNFCIPERQVYTKKSSAGRLREASRPQV